MAEPNKTKIDAELEYEKKPEDIPEEPKDDEPKEPENEKPGIIRRVFNVVTAPGRWVIGKIKESPASTAVGMVIGAGGALAAKAAIGRFGKKNNSGYIPADLPEIEIPNEGEVLTGISETED